MSVEISKVGIVYLSYHSEPYLDRALNALKKISYPFDRLELIIVDNPHPQFGSSREFIAKHARALSENNFPRITLVPLETNRGYAGGNNAGIEKALALGCDYIFLHNQDGFVDKNCLTNLVSAMRGDGAIGACQSLVLLYPETDRINSAGNCFHYLGFGYAGHYRERRSDFEAAFFSDIAQADKKNLDVGYVSGAALMLSAFMIKKYGPFDEDLQSYHEDLEYSLRLKSLGFRTALASASIFFHEYTFKRNSGKYYLMERNRWAIVLMYYRLGTLLLLLPAAAVAEIGLMVVALAQGWGAEKLAAWGYWLNPARWGMIIKKRRGRQAARLVSDKKLLAQAVGAIEFAERGIDGPFVRKFVNPILSAYWRLAKKIITW